MNMWSYRIETKLSRHNTSLGKTRFIVGLMEVITYSVHRELE